MYLRAVSKSNAAEASLKNVLSASCNPNSTLLCPTSTWAQLCSTLVATLRSTVSLPSPHSPYCSPADALCTLLFRTPTANDTYRSCGLRISAFTTASTWYSGLYPTLIHPTLFHSLLLHSTRLATLYSLLSILYTRLCSTPLFSTIYSELPSV